MDIKDFINSDIYNKAIKLLIDKTGMEIQSEYRVQYFEIDKLRKSFLSIENCMEILETDFYKIINYTIEKNKK
jgi:hypothetical protein